MISRCNNDSYKIKQATRPTSSCLLLFLRGPQSQRELPPEERDLGSRCVIGVSGPAGLVASLAGAAPLHTVPPNPSQLYSPLGSKLSSEISLPKNLCKFLWKLTLPFLSTLGNE